MGQSRPLIVILEDDPASAQALRLIVEDWGADVIVDVDSANVLARLGDRISQVSCIITDFNLGPRFNGVQAVESLRGACPNARVLVITGSFRGRADALAAAAGHPVMTKPASADAIIAWLEET